MSKFDIRTLLSTIKKQSKEIAELKVEIEKLKGNENEKRN